MEDKVYWFLDHSTELDVLKNIYILLFLYIFFQVLTKIFSYLNSNRKKWR